MNYLIKVLLIASGTLFTALGFIGIFLPLLPTTPFLLLAAICYIRSSEKLYNKLLDNKLLGSYIKNYLKGNGIPLKTKVVSITLLWLSIGFSALFIIPILWVRIVLFFIAVGVTLHITWIKTSVS